MSQTEQKPTAAVDDGKVADVKSDKHESYEAPYVQHEDNIPGSYFVHFNEDHTLEKHFAFLGVKFEVYKTSSGYHTGDISDELFRKVRSDPGVKDIHDDMYGESL